jgi:hypothetical protein
MTAPAEPAGGFCPFEVQARIPGVQGDMKGGMNSCPRSQLAASTFDKAFWAGAKIGDVQNITCDDHLERWRF